MQLNTESSFCFYQIITKITFKKICSLKEGMELLLQTWLVIFKNFLSTNDRCLLVLQLAKS